MQKGGYIYIVTNTHHTTLYVGVTSQLLNRIYQHKTHFYKRSFSARYNIEYLVYYEAFGRIDDAIAREKEIKKWRREKKITLIESVNPEWKDLYDEMNAAP
jgi:putative endonuclease